MSPKSFSRARAVLLLPLLVAGACSSESTPADAGADVAVDLGAPTDSAAPSDSSAPSDVAADAAVDALTVADAAADAGAPADAGPTRVVTVRASSAGHACALLSNGRVRCWGLNDNAQLGRTVASSTGMCVVQSAGRPLTLACEQRPYEVQGLDDVEDIALGNGTTCALRRDRTLWCWGANEAAQLGQGMGRITPTATPTQVMLPPVRHVALGAFHVCAVLMDGTVRCWGSNRFSQTGVASTASAARCDEGDGTLSACTPTPTAVQGLAGVARVSLGRNHSCALLEDGTVRCWGLNTLAQLGNGEINEDVDRYPTPVPVMGLSDAVELAAGGSHNCARRRDGTVVCWGWGNLGQLLGAPTTQCMGRGSPFDCARVPAAVPDSAGSRAVTAGRYHGCLVRADGGVRCAGRGDDGQLGATVTARCNNGIETVACSQSLVTPSLGPAVEVSVGDYHSCARGDDGTVRCWGWNAYGQLGDGTTTNRTSPVQALP